ncbi:L-rhamnonate dehydratase [Venturia nashicola]|nr:L-rhamnonate dehydratase [Venturia nashicola]
MSSYTEKNRPSDAASIQSSWTTSSLKSLLHKNQALADEKAAKKEAKKQEKAARKEKNRRDRQLNTEATFHYLHSTSTRDLSGHSQSIGTRSDDTSVPSGITSLLSQTLPSHPNHQAAVFNGNEMAPPPSSRPRPMGPGGLRRPSSLPGQPSSMSDKRGPSTASVQNVLAGAIGANSARIAKAGQK